MNKIIYLIFFISIFIHEIGHFIIAKILKKDFKIRFLLFGFYNKNTTLEGISKNKKILVFFVGPLLNLIIAIIFLNINFKYQIEIVLTNLFLGILNLLPIIPLDGGNILICFLENKKSIEKSIEISLHISKLFLIIITFLYCILILIIKNIWILMLLAYLWYLYIEEENRFTLYFKIKQNVIENKII